MDSEQLQHFLPDLDADALSRAIEHPGVRAAVEDLDLVLSKLARCEVERKTRADWEAIRDELVAEIRRLTQRLCKEP